MTCSACTPVENAATAGCFLRRPHEWVPAGDSYCDSSGLTTEAECVVQNTWIAEVPGNCSKSALTDEATCGSCRAGTQWPQPNARIRAEQPHRLLGRVRRTANATRSFVTSDVLALSAEFTVPLRLATRSVSVNGLAAVCGYQNVSAEALNRRCVHSDDHEHQPNFRWTRHAGDDSRANVSTASDRCDNHCSHRSGGGAT